MHASHDYTGSGSKAAKIAIVTALHLGVALALISMKVHVTPQKEDVIDIAQFDAPKPPEQKIEEPDLSTEKAKAPDILIPPPPIDVAAPPPLEPTVTARIDDGLPKAAPAGPGTPDGTGTKVEPAATPKTPGVYKGALANASDCILPDYPARSARNGDTGTVSLALLIGTDGRVKDARVQKSSGHRELDGAALSALSMCKFKPATTNGVAEAAWGQIAYVWALAE